MNSVMRFNSTLSAFDVSVFTGKYITGDITEDYLDVLERERGGGEHAKAKTMNNEVIGLHNITAHNA